MTPLPQPPWLASIPKHVTVIGEVKTMSPYGFTSSISRIHQLVALNAWPRINTISIHTHSDWGGSWEWLARACEASDKPVLAKGFHPHIPDVNRCLDAGATFVLTVGWWPGHRRCWQEVDSLEQMDSSLADRVVWNTRNPRTGMERPETPTDVMNVPHRWLCHASGIKKVTDIWEGVDAVLIGEGLWT